MENNEGRGGVTPRILGLRLRTAVPLEQMEAFYHGLLGFPVLEGAAGEMTFGAGATRLTFLPAAPGDGAPFYHYAWNIPENQIPEAREWLRARTTVIPPRPEIFDRLHDPRFPEDVTWFRDWNAHSVFFNDPAGNLGELIARHDLDNAAPGPFTPDGILQASEIALVVDDVSAAAGELEAALGVGPYRPGDDDFRPMGDEHGLLLVMRRGRLWGSVHGEREADVFPLEVTLAVEGARAGDGFEIPGYPYRLLFAEP